MAPNLFKTILVPVDFSPCSQEAFQIALQMAQAFQAKILLLHVIDTKALDTLNNLGLTLPSERKHQLKKLRHHARTQARQLLQVEAANKLRIQRFLSEGKPFVEIVRLARSEKVDLIVMGSYGGQTGDVSRIFFGSTAEQVVRTANCAVLCVPFPLAKVSGSSSTASRSAKKNS